MTQPASILVKKVKAEAQTPVRASEAATGFDLHACLESDQIPIGPEPVKVPTGVAIETPLGLDVQIRGRSGLSSKGVMVVLGTIDADYRGELLVSMYSLPYREPHIVHNGDRIAQLVISRNADVVLEEAEELTATARNTGGHGSTGR